MHIIYGTEVWNSFSKVAKSLLSISSESSRVTLPLLSSIHFALRQLANSPFTHRKYDSCCVFCILTGFSYCV